MRGRLFLSLVLLISSPSVAQKGDPILRGYVTSLFPDGSFELNSARVVLQPATSFSRLSGKSNTPIPALSLPFVGEILDCYGRFDRKRNLLLATHLTEVAHAPVNFTSGAIIEKVLSREPAAVVRADGFLLHLPAASELHFEDKLSPADLAPNQWIAYRGTLRPDGSVDVADATLWANRVEGREAVLRRQEYKPPLAGTREPQSTISKTVLGVRPDSFPPHNDTQLQATVEQIGESLIPAYQRILAPADPTRLSFRFQVVDAGNLLTPVTLGGGTILLPYAIVERLAPSGMPASSTAEARIAAVLADSIAVLIEKQQILLHDTNRVLPTTSILPPTIFADRPFLPLEQGMATPVTEQLVDRHFFDPELQQSGRVSLWLLHDAGYDINQAPLAWWQLSSARAKPLAELALPPRTLNLYDLLGTTWHNAAP